MSCWCSSNDDNMVICYDQQGLWAHYCLFTRLLQKVSVANISIIDTSQRTPWHPSYLICGHKTAVKIQRRKARVYSTYLIKNKFVTLSFVNMLSLEIVLSFLVERICEGWDSRILRFRGYTCVLMEEVRDDIVVCCLWRDPALNDSKNGPECELLDPIIDPEALGKVPGVLYRKSHSSKLQTTTINHEMAWSMSISWA